MCLGKFDRKLAPLNQSEQYKNPRATDTRVKISTKPEQLAQEIPPHSASAGPDYSGFMYRFNGYRLSLTW